MIKVKKAEILDLVNQQKISLNYQNDNRGKDAEQPPVLAVGYVTKPIGSTFYAGIFENGKETFMKSKKEQELKDWVNKKIEKNGN